MRDFFSAQHITHSMDFEIYIEYLNVIQMLKKCVKLATKRQREF